MKYTGDFETDVERCIMDKADSLSKEAGISLRYLVPILGLTGAGLASKYDIPVGKALGYAAEKGTDIAGTAGRWAGRGIMGAGRLGLRGAGGALQGIGRGLTWLGTPGKETPAVTPTWARRAAGATD